MELLSLQDVALVFIGLVALVVVVVGVCCAVVVLWDEAQTRTRRIRARRARAEAVRRYRVPTQR